MAPSALLTEGVTYHVASTNYWILSLVFGLTSVVILLLCAKRKKQNSVTMIRYVKNDELDVQAQGTTTPTNKGNGTFEREAEQRLSQHSMPNENRTLPEIPKKTGNGINNETPPTPDQSGTPGGASGESTQRNSASSPKRSRRLPALPPAEQVDIRQAAEIAGGDREIDATYEDLRDDVVTEPNPQTETVGSGDSALYAKVPEDVQKRDEEDSDLYAQVGGGDADQKPSTSGVQQNADSGRNASTSSEDDKTMDSPTAVTYASVDKMKKTMSIKKNREKSTSSASVAPPPPVPDRNFEEEEDAQSENATEASPPLPSQSSAEEEHNTNDNTETNTQEAVENDEQSGPAYDTVSVRESFAHQRLRQMVEDEQRNRYVNTSRDLYSQIDEENPEAVYESVSAPGSADGTVGVTGHNLQATDNNEDPSNQEDGYSTIGATRARQTAAESAPPPPPPNGEIMNPNYEDINPA